MKKVLITIRGTQGIDGDAQAVEFMTQGVIRKTAADDLVISYDDNQILGEQNGRPVKTRVIIGKNDSIVIERAGDLSSRIVIEKGVRNTCFYNVTNLDMTLGIFGKTVDNTMDERGGRISLTYAIDADLHPISENKIEITVKEVQ